MEKLIEVFNLGGLPTAPLDSFLELQEDFKKSDPDKLSKLQMLIITRGFKYAFKAWKDPDGKLWISTFDGDIFSYDTSAKKLINENKSCILGGETIKHIESDDSGHIWILKDKFVKEYNPAKKSLGVYPRLNDNN